MLLSGKPKRAIMFIPPHPPFSFLFCLSQSKSPSQQLWPGWRLKQKASPSMQFLPSVRPLLHCTWKEVCCCSLTLCASHWCRWVHIWRGNELTWLDRPGLTHPKLDGRPRRSPLRVMLGSMKALQATGSGMDPTAVLVMLDDLSMESNVMRSVMVRPMAPECSE